MEHTKDEIILQSKKIFTEENQAFLEKYDTDDKQIDYYTELACKIFDEFEIDGTYTFEGVRKTVSIWFENKREQMQIFRNHPYWNEEAKAIIFLQTETRGIDYKSAFNELVKLLDYVKDRCDIYAYHINNVKRFFRDYDINSPLIGEEFITHWNYYTDEPVHKKIQQSLRKGTKLTKFVRKLFEYAEVNGEEFDATKLADEGDPRTRESFDKYYAKFADCLSELMVEKITIASLHFCDFMTMSNGNSWSSCHFINSHGIFHESADSSYRGAYKSGCLSYAMDKPSFIFYTLPSSYDGNEYYRVQKLTRMCCQYANQILITGKCYPTNRDELITRYRQVMQLIISTAEGITNLWTFSRNTDKILGFEKTAADSTHYRDYELRDQKPTISLHKPVDIDLDNTMEIGHEVYCLDCGEKFYSNEWLQCGSHRRKRICAYCGRLFKEGDDYRVFNDEYYCEEHMFYCEHHSRYEPVSYIAHTIELHDGEIITICESALRNYSQCSSCGKYMSSIYAKSYGRLSYCKQCYEALPKCSLCGKPIVNEELCEVDGKLYHKSCSAILNTKLVIKPRQRYSVGEYVLIKPYIDSNEVYVNDEMHRYYSNRIVKLEDKWRSTFYVSNLDGCDWNWTADCFVGVVKNTNDNFIGLTPEAFMKEEN